VSVITLCHGDDVAKQPVCNTALKDLGQQREGSRVGPAILFLPFSPGVGCGRCVPEKRPLPSAKIRSLPYESRREIRASPGLRRATNVPPVRRNRLCGLSPRVVESRVRERNQPLRLLFKRRAALQVFATSRPTSLSSPEPLAATTGASSAGLKSDLPWSAPARIQRGWKPGVMFGPRNRQGSVCPSVARPESESPDPGRRPWPIPHVGKQAAIPRPSRRCMRRQSPRIVRQPSHCSSALTRARTDQDPRLVVDGVVLRPS